MADHAPLMRVEGLSTMVGDNLDLSLHEGECLVISGPSGSGKSLLLRSIVDLDPHGGEVYLSGEPSSGYPPPEWRRRIGLLPAESAWWYPTVGEHMAKGDALEGLLGQVGFAADVLQWQVERCSSGERQRLGLVRLLLQQPSVLLLDEPTASLDAENVERVEAVIAQFCAQPGQAAIWVSHDREQIARVASRVMRFSERTLVEVQV